MRVTMFHARGRHRVEIIRPGWVGYIVKGIAHSIENLDDGLPQATPATRFSVSKSVGQGLWRCLFSDIARGT